MILYFSGTGNSEYVAKRIAAKTDDEAMNLFDRLRTDDYSEISSDKPWVIVAPTYAWQMPHIVRDWLLKAELTGEQKIYFVLTCGTNIAGAGIYAKAVAAQKGMDYKGTAPVVMPENYIAMFNTPSQEKAMEIVDRAEEKIDPRSSWARALMLPKTSSCRMAMAISTPTTTLTIQAAKLPLTSSTTPKTMARMALMMHSFLLRYPSVNIFIQLSRSP